MTDRARTPEEEAEEFLRTGHLTRTHMMTLEEARERWPDAAVWRGADPARGPSETAITIVPRDPADADLAAGMSAVASRIYQEGAEGWQHMGTVPAGSSVNFEEIHRRATALFYGGNAVTEATRDTAATMSLDVIDRAILANLNRRGDPLQVERLPFVDYRSELRATRDRIAELEAENEALRKAAGWSATDAPALGGERAEGTK